MMSRIRQWLADTPIRDPVDRRNATFMQLLLIFEGVRIPATKLYLFGLHWSYLQDRFYGKARIGAPAAMAIDIGTDLAMTVSAWLGLCLIRRGRFSQAVAQFVATMLACGAVAYAAFGYRATDGNLTLMMILALSGLMLGRRALWITYGVEALILVMSVDPLKASAASHLPGMMMAVYDVLPLRALTSYLLIALIVDRSIHALRDSLIESEHRRLQLVREIAERERTQEQLLHAQKMDAVGKLASGVAHDVNNVFDIILGFSTERDRLPESDDLPPGDMRTIADALEGIELAARRGTAVCRKLLNFSRRDVAFTEEFDMVAALRELHPLLRQSLSSHNELRLRLPDAPRLIRFDRSQFELAIINLVTNARDAMPDGGCCTIAIEDGAEHTVLSVSDTGMGMAESIRAQVFEPFFTTKPAGRGTGLGLSVVQGLVVQAGGWTAVESTPGQGTTIRLSLPRAGVSAVESGFQDVSGPMYRVEG
ncbi:ATP-binding protein [Dyella sp. 333MFSha]|uniref:sensor histidine kinase n=1 Tax=Dyella sp. 333MFSha TaxID=1798240 RepID=UPI00088290E7|nr:ATP-binding protein [Dyella sp. 333MFSha]SDG68987.1 Histidine kinase-, DNA gyrase B-, and HSP90-like ATPase [Dyella sp. 333MFSha]